jgi:hypothetical protein
VSAVAKPVDPDQLELFQPTDPPVVLPKRGKVNGKPRWSQYRPKYPVKCDDCMLLLVQTQGQAPASRAAKFRRQQGGNDLLLCYGHAQARRDEDGLAPVE